MILTRTSALVAALLVASGCAPEEEDAPETSDRLRTGFADEGMVVAGVQEGDQLTVYVCGGEDNYDTHTRWFIGLTITDGVVDGQSEGWTLHGDVDAADGRVVGTLADGAGTEHPFSLEPTRIATIAGLYTAATDGCTTGVIVWEAGTDESTGEPAYGAQGTWCNSTSEFEQVIILEPLALTDGGIPVSVERTGFEEFSVTPF